MATTNQTPGPAAPVSVGAYLRDLRTRQQTLRHEVTQILAAATALLAKCRFGCNGDKCEHSAVSRARGMSVADRERIAALQAEIKGIDETFRAFNV